jgi:hypothetical protein
VLGSVEVLQSMHAEVHQLDVVGEVIDGELPCRPGHQHLPAMGDRPQAGRADDPRADVVQPVA